MADDDFDPSAFAAAKPEQPAAGDDQFNPNAFAATKPTKPAPTFLGAVADAVPSYWKNLKESSGSDISTINETLNPFSEGYQKAEEKREKDPSLFDLSGLSSTGHGLAAAASLPFSPLTALMKSAAPIVAAPMTSAEQAVGEPIARGLNPDAKLPSREDVYEKTEPSVETALGLIIPRGFKGSSIAAPPPPAAPAPPGSDTFGVTLSKGEETGDLPTRKVEEAAKKAQAGDPVYRVAQPFVEQRSAELEAAKDNATSKIGTTGNIEARTPEQGGEIVRSALQSSEGADAAAKKQALDAEETQLRPQGTLIHPHDAAGVVQRSLSDTADQAVTATGSNRAALDADRESIRNSLSPNGQVLASAPLEAADIVTAGVTRAEEMATDARDAAYDKFSGTPGSFRPQAFTNVTNKVRQKLNDPSDPVILNDKTTPMAMQAIDELGRVLEEPAAAAADPNTKSFTPFTPSRIDDVRKRIGAYSKQANATARATNDYSDVRAMGRVQDAFDETVSDALKRKRLFDGDGKAVQQAWDDAHAAHSTLRRTFYPQGKGDTVGPIINKIVGQREGQAMPADAVDAATAAPGRPTPVLVGRRLQQIFGKDSPEIGAIKQSLWSKAVDPTPGAPPLDPVTAAKNIEDLRSSDLARTHFTPDELARMRQHAIDLRNSVPPKRASTDVVGKALEKIVGANGQPSTPGELSNTLFGRGNALGVKIAQHVKNTHGEASPEFRAIQSGQISSLARVEQGRAGFDPKGIAQDIRDFINGSGRDMADTLYTPDMKRKLSDYADRLDSFAAKSSPPKNVDPLDATVAKITGSDGKGGSSAMEILNKLFNAASPADKQSNLRLLDRLKQVLPPEKMTALKQVLFRQAIEPGPGENLKTWSSANIVKKIADLYNKSPEMMRALYTPDENKMIKEFQALHEKLIPPQPSQQQWNLPVVQRAIGASLKYIGMLLGSMLHLPHPLGEIAGYAGASAIGKMREASQVKQVAKLLPMAAEKMAAYQKAVTAAQRTGLPPYKALANAAGVELSHAMSQFGINWNGIVAAAAQDQKGKKEGPQNQKRSGGAVQPDTRAHGGKISDSRSRKPAEHPVIHGARLAPDGHYYVNDPGRPGKFMRVVERARDHAVA